ncbi:hypothetical protein MKL49_15935, partial [Brucella abortus]|nr:hypothetical protein [Brucella abortus]
KPIEFEVEVKKFLSAALPGPVWALFARESDEAALHSRKPIEFEVEVKKFLSAALPGPVWALFARESDEAA